MCFYEERKKIIKPEKRNKVTVKNTSCRFCCCCLPDTRVCVCVCVCMRVCVCERVWESSVQLQCSWKPYEDDYPERRAHWLAPSLPFCQCWAGCWNTGLLSSLSKSVGAYPQNTCMTADYIFWTNDPFVTKLTLMILLWPLLLILLWPVLMFLLWPHLY